MRYVLALAILLLPTLVTAQEHKSQYLGAEVCSSTLSALSYDVLSDPSVKIAKHGDNLMLDSPKGSVHVWCESGWLKTAITTKGGQLSKAD